MLIAKVEIEGTKPLIFHRFNIESLQELSKPKSGSAGNDPEEWKMSFFHDDLKLYIPGSYIFSALKNGSVNTKAGRGTIQKTWISAVQVDDEKIYLNYPLFKGWEEMTLADIPKDPINKVYVDIRMVSNPNTKGKNIRYRLACNIGWKINFSLTINDSLVSKAQVEKVINDTGMLQGLCDGRTLGYGRFKVNSCNLSTISKD